MTQPTTEKTRDEQDLTDAIVGNRAVSRYSPEMQREIEQRRVEGQLTAAIASMTWGQSMPVPLRRAVAQFAFKYGIEPLTELDILGGNIYVNADYYLRRLGELRDEGVIRDFWLDHIHADARDDEILKDEHVPADMKAETAKRRARAMQARVDHNAPEEAAAICVCNIVLADGGHPIQGCKWGGNGTSHKQPARGGGSQPNPIVEDNAELSVESQAIRRAMRQITSHARNPINLFHMDNALDELNKRVEPVMHEIAAAAESVETPKPMSVPLAVMGTASDPYGNEVLEPHPVDA